MFPDSKTLTETVLVIPAYIVAVEQRFIHQINIETLRHLITHNANQQEVAKQYAFRPFII